MLFHFREGGDELFVTIGVVGPSESVDKILKVAEEFPSARCLPFIYEDVKELPNLIKQGQLLVDQWLFSGVMNHTYALKHRLVQPEQASFPLLHGSSFFGKLLEIQQKEQRIFQSFSIDHITAEEIQKVLSFYDMDHLHFETIPFSIDKEPEQIAHIHQVLYESKKTEVAITATRGVYDRLKRQAIPVYRLTPSYFSIKLSIELLIERAQVKHYENLRMAVIACQALNANENIDASLFKWKHQDLDLKKSLLTLTERLNGSFVEVADGLYYIYTTKGEIDTDIESSLMNNIASFRIHNQLEIGFAIGYGQTVLAAEQHARHGLNQLKMGGEPSLLIVQTKDDITQKVQNEEHTLNTEAITSALQERYELKNANTRDVLRIALYSRKYNKPHFTAEDVAQWFNSTKRNARRILSELQQDAIIEIHDKTQAAPRGRPSNVYRFTDNDLFFGKES